MGLFGIGKKNKKSSSSAPAKKAPKDILSFEDHVNGAHAVMAAQDTEDFDPKKVKTHLVSRELRDKFGYVDDFQGYYNWNKYGYILNESYGSETPKEKIGCLSTLRDANGKPYLPETLAPFIKKERIGDHTYYWYQLPAAEAVSVTANKKTGEIIFQDKLVRTGQMIVAQYDERRQGFSSVKIYNTKNKYLEKDSIDFFYSIDWNAGTKALKERAERCAKRFGSLFGYRVLGDMEYFDLGRNRKPNGYVDILGDFIDTPEEVMEKTMEKAREKMGRFLSMAEKNKEWKLNIILKRDCNQLDTAELSWILVNYVLPQFEMDNRDQRAYQNYVDTVHSIREQCNADMRKRHPGYRIPEDGANGDMQHLEDIMYCDRVNEEIQAREYAEKMANNPAGYVGEKTTENKEILRQIQDLALRYAKGMMTELEEEEDRRMRAERAVAKMLNEERNDD